jgi:P2 family phage contractile tail tube protein
MPIQSVLKNVNAFVDGKGYAGQVEEVQPPKRTLKTEEFRGGGMDAPVELTMGMEKLEGGLTLVSYDTDILSNFGVVEGNQIQFTIRGLLEDFDGTTHALVQNMTGKIKELDPGNWKPGEKPQLKIMLALSYFKETVDGVVITEIDVQNMIFMQGGVDLLAAARAALGI